MKSQSDVRALLPLVRPQMGAFLGGLACVFVVIAVDLALPLFFGRGVIDQALLGEGDPRLLTLFSVAAIGLFAVKGLFSYGQVYLMSYVGHRSLHNLRSKLFGHLLQLPVGYFARRGQSEILSRATHDIAVVQSTLSAGVADAVQHGLMLLGILFFIFWVNWKLALVALVVLPLAALAVSAFGSRIRTQSRRLNERIAGLTTLLSETLDGIRVVKAFTMEKKQEERFVAENEQGFQASMRSAQATATLTPIVEIILVCGMVVVIWFGGLEVLAGRLTMGDMIAFLAYLGMATRPVSQLTRSVVLFQQAAAAVARISQLMEAEPEAQGPAPAIDMPAVRGKIVCRDLEFAYEPGRPVLRTVNLEIGAGETVALVGPSGAGKSTLAALIPRFFDAQSGRIEIDGHDIRRVSLPSLRSQIGLVPQETVLFEGTVLENIVVGRTGFRREEIEAAARVANAHEFIARLPNGYDTQLGEGGAALSGGQRQRLAIARAMLGDPRILIFDEATSNLDSESEQLIQEAFERALVGRTAVVIAHRAATVRMADRVIVMSNGRIVQQGRHAELLASPGMYRRLFGALHVAGEELPASG